MDEFEWMKYDRNMIFIFHSVFSFYIKKGQWIGGRINGINEEAVIIWKPIVSQMYETLRSIRNHQNNRSTSSFSCSQKKHPRTRLSFVVLPILSICMILSQLNFPETKERSSLSLWKSIRNLNVDRKPNLIRFFIIIFWIWNIISFNFIFRPPSNSLVSRNCWFNPGMWNENEN